MSPTLIRLFAFLADAIMHDRSVFACPGNAGEGDVHQRIALGAKSLEPLSGVDFGEFACWCDIGEPGQEAGHCGPITQMRLA